MYYLLDMKFEMFDSNQMVTCLAPYKMRDVSKFLEFRTHEEL